MSTKLNLTQIHTKVFEDDEWVATQFFLYASIPKIRPTHILRRGSKEIRIACVEAITDDSKRPLEIKVWIDVDSCFLNLMWDIVPDIEAQKAEEIEPLY